MSKCRLCEEPLVEVLDLGIQPLGNGFLSDSDTELEYLYHLRCGFSTESNLFQLFEQPKPSLMFNESYAFLSSTSSAMKTHFRDLAEKCVSQYLNLNPKGFVVEIGCNDGIFLENIAQQGLRHLGIEPSSNVEQIAASKGVHTVCAFFSLELAREIREQDGRADLIVATNVLCHMPNLREVTMAVDELLTDDGFLITEDPYLGSILKINSYDQIYDEHVFLFSALSMQYAFSSVGLEIIDVEHQPVHGGSMRYVLARSGKYTPTNRAHDLLRAEKVDGLDRVDTYYEFAHRVEKSAVDLRQTLTKVLEESHHVAAFGATSKSTTIYNFAGIDSSLISKIYDNSPTKIGKFSPGMRIPIVSSELFPEESHRYVFLAAWNHETEIRQRYRSFEGPGRRWIVHVPHVRFL